MDDSGCICLESLLCSLALMVPGNTMYGAPKMKQLNSPSLLNTHALRQLPAWQDTQKFAKSGTHMYVYVCVVYSHTYIVLCVHVCIYTYMC